MMKILTLLITFLPVSAVVLPAQVVPDELYRDLPFKMEKIQLPQFPPHTFNIKDFGAIGNGAALCTDAFHRAIEAATAQGGGKIVVPEGIWLTGPVVLQDNINLYLEQGAVMVFSDNFDLYPIVNVSFEGLDTRRCQSPVSAKGATNIAITGNGIIDGSGDAWRPVKKSKLSSSEWKEKIRRGGVLNEKGDTWYPSRSALEGSKKIIDQNVPDVQDENRWNKIKDFLRPVMISLVECKNVWLDGVTFQNSPAWNIHPLLCENLLVTNIYVRNPWYSQNGDGIDIESCKNIVVYNCRFDVGDDAICIKSGKNEDGRRRGVATENLLVNKCLVYHGHGGFVVGSEMSGGVKNIKVSQCTFLGTDTGLRFKSTRGRGGIVENIWISDIAMKDIPAEPLLFDLFYGGKSAIEARNDEAGGMPEPATLPAVDETTPQFRNIFIRNVTCKGADRAMYFNGLPEMNVKNVQLENVYIEADEPAIISETDGLTLKNVTVIPKKGTEPVIFRNTKNIVCL
ncbi:MAG: glycoside hydrolase family 28 protein [Prevotellaceae bacterium]|jgi:polygalacturonase|nr:glycoside hydrolase family 28 protein [Prevotellaceae bacterium]